MITSTNPSFHFLGKDSTYVHGVLQLQLTPNPAIPGFGSTWTKDIANALTQPVFRNQWPWPQA